MCRHDDVMNLCFRFSLFFSHLYIYISPVALRDFIAVAFFAKTKPGVRSSLEPDRSFCGDVAMDLKKNRVKTPCPILISHSSSNALPTSTIIVLSLDRVGFGTDIFLWI
jgi:hypothetical protein